MSALLLALALMIDPEPVDQPLTETPTAEASQAPTPAPDPTPTPPVEEVDVAYPPDAPKDDYGLVSWCYGVLSGYLELHDRVLPEVTRIEGAFRQPGSSLAEDMAVYEDMRKVSRANMKLFARAMEAAERASLRPISQAGAAAVTKGRSNWAAAANLPTRTVAQQWMGWTLPAVCPTRAVELEARSKLMGATFKVNEAPTEMPEAPPAEPVPASVPEDVTGPAPVETVPPKPQF